MPCGPAGGVEGALLLIQTGPLKSPLLGWPGRPRIAVGEFIERAGRIHQGQEYKYKDLEKLNQVEKNTTITVTCPKHGAFEVQPEPHLDGRGCPVCSSERINPSWAEFVTKAERVHKGSGYSYEHVEYLSGQIPVRICCPQHGIFEQTPKLHLKGRGCPACWDRKSQQPKPEPNPLTPKSPAVTTNLMRSSWAGTISPKSLLPK